MKTLKDVLVKNLANNKIVEIYMNYEKRNELSVMMRGTSGDLMKVLSNHFQHMKPDKVIYGYDSIAVVMKVGI